MVKKAVNPTPDKKEKVKVTHRKLKDYKLDNENPNKGTPQGNAMLETSVERFGAGRSGVVDKDGVIRAGNHTAEQLFQAGIEDVVEVEIPDGNTWVVVKRADMDENTGKEYAVADNRTGQLIGWDPKILAELDKQIDLRPYFDAKTLERFHKKAGSDAQKPEMEITPELFERQDYLVIIFDNEFDWNVLTEKFGVKTVKDAQIGARTIPKQGIGRVLKASDVLRRLKEDNA